MLHQLIEEDNETSEGGTVTRNSTIFLSRSFEGDKLANNDIIQPTFLRGETPDTILSLKPLYPDINIYCSTCSQQIFIGDLTQHRQYHKALKGFGLSSVESLKIEDLVKQRKLFIDQIDHIATKEDKLVKIHKIDLLYNFLLKIIKDDNHNTIKFPLEEKHIEVEKVTSKPLNCSVACCVGVGVASSMNGYWRQSMEDHCVFQDYFGNHRSKSYAAVFDGYGGPYAAKLASEELHHSLLYNMKRFDPLVTSCFTYNMAEDCIVDQNKEEIHRPNTTRSSRVATHISSTNLIQTILHNCEERLNSLSKETADDNIGNSSQNETEFVRTNENNKGKCDDLYSSSMKESFRKAYCFTDHLLTRGQDTASSVRWSGCSATTVVLSDTFPKADEDDDDAFIKKSNSMSSSDTEVGRIYLANVGSSHCILLRNNTPYRITQEHSTRRKCERKRVVSLGGKICKVNESILLNGVMTQTRALGSHGEPGVKRCLISEPHCVAVPVDSLCQALVLASSGLWSVLNETEVANIVVCELPCNFSSAPFYNEEVEDLHRGSTPSAESDVDSDNKKIIDGFVIEEDDFDVPVIESEEFGMSCTPFSTRKKSQFDLSADCGAHSVAATTTEEKSCLEGPLTENSIPNWGSLVSQEIAKKLVQAALLAGSRENISVIVVLFDKALDQPFQDIQKPIDQQEDSVFEEDDET